jgi:hypothetical protein
MAAKRRKRRKKRIPFLRLLCFVAANPMGHVAGVYGAPKRRKTEVRFGPDEQGQKGTDTANPGQGESK